MNNLAVCLIWPSWIAMTTGIRIKLSSQHSQKQSTKTSKSKIFTSIKTNDNDFFLVWYWYVKIVYLIHYWWSFISLKTIVFISRKVTSGKRILLINIYIPFRFIQWHQDIVPNDADTNNSVFSLFYVCLDGYLLSLLFKLFILNLFVACKEQTFISYS